MLLLSVPFADYNLRMFEPVSWRSQLRKVITYEYMGSRHNYLLDYLIRLRGHDDSLPGGQNGVNQSKSFGRGSTSGSEGRYEQRDCLAYNPGKARDL